MTHLMDTMKAAGTRGLALAPVAALLLSVAFLLLQDVALGLAALIMLPVQLTILPRLQKRVNLRVRQRVLATRMLGALVTAPMRGRPSGHPSRAAEPGPAAAGHDARARRAATASCEAA